MLQSTDLEGIAQAAWETYYDEYYKKYHAFPLRIGTVASSSKYHDTFVKIALICDREKIDIRDYIKKCFLIINKQRIHITPKDFAKIEFVDKYRKLSEKMTINPETSYMQQDHLLCKLLMNNSDKYRNEEDILYNIGTPFLAWFRIFYFDQLNENIFKVFSKEAWEELQQDVELRRFLRLFKPQLFEQFEEKTTRFGD
ncbi:hypothetical protein ACFLQL_00425 [Verrucomicrobiota bacterium]